MADQLHLPITKVPCTRTEPNQNEVLQIFRSLCPQNCDFEPTQIWASQTKQKNCTCHWNVLYTVKDPTTNMYLQGTPARCLRDLLMQSAPGNATIIDYGFQEHYIPNKQGWVMKWKVQCDHLINLNNGKEELPMPIMSKNI